MTIQEQDHKWLDVIGWVVSNFFVWIFYIESYVWISSAFQQPIRLRCSQFLYVVRQKVGNREDTIKPEVPANQDVESPGNLLESMNFMLNISFRQYFVWLKNVILFMIWKPWYFSFLGIKYQKDNLTLTYQRNKFLVVMVVNNLELRAKTVKLLFRYSACWLNSIFEMAMKFI